MKISKKRLREIIKEEFQRVNEAPAVSIGKNTEFYQGFSSKEAKNAIDKGVRDYSTLLRKAQYKIIKDWMTKAKAGVVDYFDLVRGLQTGDAKREHPYETEFLMAMLNKERIMDRFRRYFGGKKGKKGRTK